MASPALTTRHGRANGIRMRCLSEAHDALETSCAVEVAAVGGPVARVDGVVDAASGFLAAIRNRELANRPTDGLGGALLQTVLLNGGRTPDQKAQGGSGEGGEGANVHFGVRGFQSVNGS